MARDLLTEAPENSPRDQLSDASPNAPRVLLDFSAQAEPFDFSDSAESLDFSSAAEPLDFSGSTEPFAGADPGLAAEQEAFNERYPFWTRRQMDLERGWEGLKGGFSLTAAGSSAEQIRVYADLDRLRREGAPEQEVAAYLDRLRQQPGGPIPFNATLFFRASDEGRAAMLESAGRTFRESFSNYLTSSEAASQIPQSPVVRVAMEARGIFEALETAGIAPLEFIASVGTESLPASAPALAAGILTGGTGGLALGAATTGGVSFTVDHIMGLREAFQDVGVDANDPVALRAALQDPEKLADARAQAAKHALPVAIFDALSFGLAGKVLTPFTGAITKPATNLTAQTGAQAAAGAAGEAAGQMTAGRELKPGEILAEAAGEMVTAPGEVAGATYAAGKDALAGTRSAPSNLTDDDLRSPIRNEDISEGKRIIAEADLREGAMPAAAIIGVEVEETAPAPSAAVAERSVGEAPNLTPEAFAPTQTEETPPAERIRAPGAAPISGVFGPRPTEEVAGLAGSEGVGHGPAPSETRAAATAETDATPPADPFAARPMQRSLPSNNEPGPLSRHAPVMFRDVAPDQVADLLPVAASRGRLIKRPFVVTDLPVRGEGGAPAQVGINFAFDTSKLVGRISDAAPQWQQAYRSGSADFTVNAPTMDVLRRAIIAIRVPHGALRGRAGLAKALKRLRRSGWARSEGSGFTEYRRADAPETLPAATAAAEINEDRARAEIRAVAREMKEIFGKSEADQVLAIMRSQSMPADEAIVEFAERLAIQRDGEITSQAEEDDNEPIPFDQPAQDGRAAGTESRTEGRNARDESRRPARSPSAEEGGSPPAQGKELGGREKFSLVRPDTPDSAENRQHIAQGFIARGQPLDRAMRIPFDWFGGVNDPGEWQPGAKMFDRAAAAIRGAEFSDDSPFAWMNGMLNAARAGLIDRYGLDEAYVRRERQLDLDKRAVAQKGVEILESLKQRNIGPEEARVLQAVLTGEAVADSDMAKLAAPIRQAIDELGTEAVSLGLVSPESYERNRATYLHRVYLKHEGEQPLLSKWASNFMTSRRKRIQGDSLKGRGMFLDVTVDRAMRDDPDFAGGRRGKPATGERFLVLDKMQEQDTLPDVAARAAPPKIERRVFWPADREVPTRFAGFTNRGTWVARRTLGDKVTLWRDYTAEERASMGEILDARYTIGKTFALLAQDLSTGRFYHDIALNKEWTVTDEPAGKWVNAESFRRLLRDQSVEWVKVPDTDIPNAGGKKRWGALAGKYVRAEIWADLNELQILTQPTLWTQLLSSWKLMKTARSPVVHMNNVVSNLVFMDLADVRAQDLVRGLRAYVRETADYREAADHGAFGSDIISQEIKRNVLLPILDDLQKQVGGGHNPVLAKAGVLGRIAEAIWSRAKKVDRSMVEMYRLEDEIFRMALYMRRRSLGDSPENAASEARQQFLDYDIRAPWVNTARSTVLPFISYTYRAAPVIARSIATRPWKLAKYFTIAYALNALAYMLEPGDEDEERRSMRDEEKGYTWIGVERMLRMPYRDEQGNPVFLDIRRWIPAGDIFDINQGHGVFQLPAPLNLGGPLMIGAELVLNKSAFTGEEIVNHLTDTLTDRLSKTGDYLWKAWMPSAAWVPGSWYWDKIGLALRGATDSRGRPYPVPEAIASSFGVKLKPQDVEGNLHWRVWELDKQRRALVEERRRLLRLHERRMISDEALDEGIDAVIRKLEIVDKAQEEILH